MSSWVTGCEYLIETPRSPRDSCPTVQHELDGNGLVEAVPLDEVIADGVRRPLAQDGPARVAGNHAGKREHDEDRSRSRTGIVTRSRRAMNRVKRLAPSVQIRIGEPEGT